MSTSSERIEVFQDTLNWIENDIELSASVIYSKEHTKIYWENDYPEFDGAKECDTEVTVTRDRSYQAAMRLRTSTLYPLLYRKTLRDTFYKHHRTLKTPKATDALIYTEDVVICKTDEDLPRRMPREQWVNVDVITVAAPDLRDKSNHYAPLVGGGTFMKNAELFGYHVKRAIHVCSRAGCRYFGIGCIWLRRVPERPGSGGASL